MAENIISKRIDRFLGLNNLLNPASAEYREGMAYRAKDCRLDRTGVWAARPVLESSTEEPGALTAWGSGNHYKNLAVQGTDKIIGSIATTESIDVGANEILYGTTGSGAVKRQLAAGTKSDVAAPTNPTVSSPPADTGAVPTRQENGTYFYIFTSYNSTYKHESIPAKAYQVELADNTANSVTMTITENDDSDEIKIYRSLRTSVTDSVYAPNNKFYFIGTATSGAAYVDRLHDQEIIGYEYEGRGSTPPEAQDYLSSWNNRMYYFKDNICRWSSAGRPQEVAQEYTIPIETTEGGDTVTVTCMPLLSVGRYDEAKYEIAELSSKTITGAISWNGRLWLFTANTVGYLIPTNQLEGVRYKGYRTGIGLVNDKCLVETPYGIFGADRQGMWLLDNYGELKRLTDGAIDLIGGADTTLTQSYVSDSFIVWVPILNEAWWSMQYADTPTYIQIVYHADRKIFTGPYTHSITGGCNFVNTTGAYAYVTGDKIVSTDTADTTVAQYLDFWFGQSDPVAIKDQLEVQPEHSATPGDSVTAKVYQNNIASISGITAKEVSYTDVIKNIKCVSQGKLFKLELTLPAAGAAMSTINYRYNVAGWIWADRFKR